MDFKKCKTAQVLYKVRYNLQLGNVQRIFIYLFIYFDREGDYNPKAKLNFKTPNAQTIVKTSFSFVERIVSHLFLSMSLSIYLLNINFEAKSR